MFFGDVYRFEPTFAKFLEPGDREPADLEHLLEATDDYIHVKTSINDGSLVWALKPITSSFLIYRDGRIEI